MSCIACLCHPKCFISCSKHIFLTNFQQCTGYRFDQKTRHVGTPKFDHIYKMWRRRFCVASDDVKFSVLAGVKVLFRVGLVLIRYALGRRGIIKQCPSMYETVEFLRNLPPEIMHESVLVHEVCFTGDGCVAKC